MTHLALPILAGLVALGTMAFWFIAQPRITTTLDDQNPNPTETLIADAPPPENEGTPPFRS
ncbi:hypothetical protein L3556_12640 [Candidatus Synechococcus calcipolaris G9]|uniref:Uncharacterized protein n=1 Tax=Candidatus Synechococcus calcipolaris G9 TaxID=1497997 RepID=A0ABT6F1N3_9SYNE|nr:hypothetical protein [Candidatus Synechococcus calcipolaris]MDG2991770.1 hypothetical protein [Candidatus Synechococcus calcipolaris G9]